MSGGNNVTTADGVDNKFNNEPQGTEKTIHIGVFFDGTGNNKFQVMMGKLFRNKQAISSHPKAKRADGQPMSISEFRAKGRSYWEDGTLTKSQLDEIFFGYDEKTETGTYFVENSVHHVDLVAQKYPMVDETARETKHNLEIYDIAKKEYTRAAGAPPISTWDDVTLRLTKGGDTQDSTYTNVAILEALYKSDDNEYYPIYVEGAGTNMDLGILGGQLDLLSGGTGIGFTGVSDKVKRAVNAVTRICEKYYALKNAPNAQKVTKLTVMMSTYGFSRGATEARMFSYEFDPDNTYMGEKKRLLSDSSWLKKTLEYVGIFDTVSSVVLNDARDLHLYAVEKAKRMLHLCAMDEFRCKFELTDASSAFGQGLELFLPGCHTDVGGGTSIGVDDWKDIGTSKALFCKWGRSDSKEHGDVNVYTLIDMGWLPHNAKELGLIGKTFSDGDKEVEKYGALYRNAGSEIQIKKYVKPGYTNIPLNLMYEDATKNGLLFNTIPSPYQVPTDLSSLYSKWKNDLGLTGQQFVAVTDDEYRKLRQEYLHYSGDRGVKFWNNVTHKDTSSGYRIITRKIYDGSNSSSPKDYYLCDLAGNKATPTPPKYYWVAPSK